MTAACNQGHHEQDQMDSQGYRFVALRSAAEVTVEGAAMHHCVASYVPDMVSGRCRLYSIRKREKRIATLELKQGYGNALWVSGQIKGPCNSRVSAKTNSAVREFCTEINTSAMLRRNGAGLAGRP